MDDREIEAAVALLNRHPDFRVLRKLEIDAGRTGAVPVGGSWTGVVLATRTIPLGTGVRALVEVSMRRIRFDRRGAVVDISDRAGWLEDLTGIDLDDVVAGSDAPATTGPYGSEMEAVRGLLSGTDVIVAHDARAHRPFVADLFPETSGIGWYCMLDCVDWKRRGFGGRSIGELLQHVGLFGSAHGAEGDVDSLICMILLSAVNGDSVLMEAIRGEHMLRVLQS